MHRRLRIGLALGGGAARAVTHIGVLDALQQHGIPVDVIAGTSMGAIIGALYAIEPDVPRLREKMLAYTGSEEFRTSKFDFMNDQEDVEGGGVFYRFSQFARRSLFYSLSLARRSFVDDETAARNFAFLVPDVDIEALRIPFCATATDLNSGEEYIFTKGNLRRAIAASCALPGVLPPVELDGRCLIDGGWVEAVPVEPAFALGADFVIAIDIPARFDPVDPAARGLDIVFRADAVSRNALAREKLKRADIVLRPQVVNHWADFSRMDEQIEHGRREVAVHIGEIRSAIQAKRRNTFWRRILP